MGGLINYAGAVLLILVGISFHSHSPDPTAAGTPALALPLIIAGLLWGGVVLDGPLRGGRHCRSEAGSLRIAPSPGAGHARHRRSRPAPARRLTAEKPIWARGRAVGRADYAKDATATTASAPKGLLRVAAGEAKKNHYSARAFSWAVLSAFVLALTSSDLLLTDGEIPPVDRSAVLRTLASLTVGLSLFPTGLLAADRGVGENGRGMLLVKVLGATAAWPLIYAISIPYILVAGFDTSVPWVALIYTLVLGTLCVSGFAALIVGLGALPRSGRGARSVSVAVLFAMTAPTVLGPVLRKGRFGDAYDALSPVAWARLSLEGVIMDKEGPLSQLPHVGALLAFVAVAGGVAALSARGTAASGGRGRDGARVGPDPWGWHGGTLPPGRTGPGLADPDAQGGVGP